MSTIAGDGMSVATIDGMFVVVGAAILGGT